MDKEVDKAVVGSNPTAGSLVNRGLAPKPVLQLGHFLDTFDILGESKEAVGLLEWPQFTGQLLSDHLLVCNKS